MICLVHFLLYKVGLNLYGCKFCGTIQMLRPGRAHYTRPSLGGMNACKTAAIMEMVRDAITTGNGVVLVTVDGVRCIAPYDLVAVDALTAPPAAPDLPAPAPPPPDHSDGASGL